jgi:predicted acylesterase/phospholipase RssA
MMIEQSDSVTYHQQYQYQRQQKQQDVETVLVMQTGGSLGAYECGIYKTLAKHNIWFDIIAGASIGSVNATIIAASLRSQGIENLESNSSNRHESPSSSSNNTNSNNKDKQ